MAGKNKVYAIHFTDGREDPDVLVATWEECSEYIKGAPNMYKGFKDPKDAEDWLAGITEDKEKRHKENVAKHRSSVSDKAQNGKTYTFTLPEDCAKALDEELMIMNISLGEYMADLIRTDLLGKEDEDTEEDDEELPF